MEKGNKVRVRNMMLLPTVQYGNFTLECDVTLEVSPGENVAEKLKEAHNEVLESLKEQRKVISELEAKFFKSPL